MSGVKGMSNLARLGQSFSNCALEVFCSPMLKLMSRDCGNSVLAGCGSP